MAVRGLHRLRTGHARSGADRRRWSTLFELAALADRPIDQLSTGERARAMLGAGDCRAAAAAAARRAACPTSIPIGRFGRSRSSAPRSPPTQRGAGVGPRPRHGAAVRPRAAGRRRRGDRRRARRTRCWTARRSASAFRVRTSATAAGRSASRRVGDHGGEIGFGGQLAVDRGAARRICTPTRASGRIRRRA